MQTLSLSRKTLSQNQLFPVLRTSSCCTLIAFLWFNQRKSRFSWNASADELQQFFDARFVMGNEDGNEDGDCTSGKLKRSCNGSCVVLKLPCATFNLYLITKMLQIQGSACGDIRKFLEEIVKSVPAAQTSNYDDKSEDAESTELTNDFSPANGIVGRQLKAHREFKFFNR